MAKHWKLILFGGVGLFMAFGSSTALLDLFGYYILIIPVLVMVFGIVECVRWTKICSDENKRIAEQMEIERNKAAAEQYFRQLEAERMAKARREAIEARRKEQERQQAEITSRRAGTISQEFAAAGVMKHQNIFRKYGDLNPDYNMTKKEFEENYCYDDVYKYDFVGVSVDLEREPDNPVDPNAVKVLMEGELIGYIPKETAPHVAWLMDNDRIVDCEVRVVGGPLKRFDPAEETIEKVPLNFGVRITLYVHPEDADGE